jgi:hypothetical protein
MKPWRIGVLAIWAISLFGPLSSVYAEDGTPTIVPPANAPATAPFPPSAGAYDIVYQLIESSEKRGVSKIIEYRVSLYPDPARPRFFVGKGTYSGHVVLRRLNCLQGPDNPHTIDVNGKIEATAFLRSAGIPAPELSLTLKTVDWPIMFPAVEGAEIAKTPNDRAAVAGLGSVFLLPGAILKDDETQDERNSHYPGGECDGELLSRVRVYVRKNPKPKELKAIITATQGRQRGDTMTLDGSSSTPRDKIASYHWKITPEPDCPKGVNGFEREAKTLSFRSLCSMQAELTVKATASDDTDTAMQQVAMAARPWNVTLVRNDEPGRLNSHFRIDQFPRLGKNLCSHEAKDGDQESGHYIHKKKDSSTWNEVGYQIETIHDKDGPFDGWSFIKSQKLEINRSVLISGELFPDAEVYKLNRIACLGKTGSKCMLDLVIAATTAHETSHTDLLHEAAKTKEGNGAKRIESLAASPDEGPQGLIKKADSELSQVETVLLDATKDDNVVPRVKAKVPAADGGGYLLVPDVEGGGYSPYNFPNISNNGD